MLCDRRRRRILRLHPLVEVGLALLEAHARRFFIWYSLCATPSSARRTRAASVIGHYIEITLEYRHHVGYMVWRAVHERKSSARCLHIREVLDLTIRR
jgi:hypothetical protein